MDQNAICLLSCTSGWVPADQGERQPLQSIHWQPIVKMSPIFLGTNHSRWKESSLGWPHVVVIVPALVGIHRPSPTILSYGEHLWCRGSKPNYPVLRYQNCE